MEPADKPSTTRAELFAAAKEASGEPGVYLMKSAGGQILYIGKAKSLRNRLVTYFKGTAHEVGRTELLVQRIQRFDVILTPTEAEALILECALIKKHKPKYNVRLKDDKAFPYIRVAQGEDFPRLEWTRRVIRDGSRYYGPFPSAYDAKQVMKLLTETFKLRDCSDNTFRHRSRPCILHQMGRCSGPCVGLVTRDRYREDLREAMEVLEGRGTRLLEGLERGMRDASEREEYEEAARLRDQIRSVRLVSETQSVVGTGAERNRDVIGLARHEGVARVAMLQIRNGRLLAVRHFTLQNADPSFTDTELLGEFLVQYSLGQDPVPEAAVPEAAPPGGMPIAGDVTLSRPREILVPQAVDEADSLERAIGARVRVPENDEDRHLTEVAAANAKSAVESRRHGDGGHGIEALEEAQEKLQLPKLPSRIECYDISNIHGQDAVGSRVVFIDGAPDKNLYRRYKIRTVEGANDFAMMKEVLSRRFGGAGPAGAAGAGAGGAGSDTRKSRENSFEAPLEEKNTRFSRAGGNRGETPSGAELEDLPDLVVVDGGKGQLAQAVAILEELNIQGVAAVGLAKARTESDFEATELKSSHERIFIPGRKNPVNLLPHTAAYKLLVHVRDEAHRFAVSYHRLLRSKRSLKSGD
ncbi:MAG: excinuclease ABC subunit C [Bdellovibrionales bacterium]|nr:excinuclease ABC subunit C [Bdellovibrionales bacterium]